MQLNLLRKLAKAHPFIAKAVWYKFFPIDFSLKEKLYHGFRASDLDKNTGELEANSIRFPDFSCNWDKFSKPEAVRLRQNGSVTDGCFSFTVEQSHYKQMATPCHDPLKKEKNYSHIEVRQLKLDEPISFEPPKNRKLKKQIDGWSPSQRLEYRQNIVFNLIREIEPSN